MSKQLHKDFSDARVRSFFEKYSKKKSNLATSCKFLESREIGSLNYFLNNEKIRITLKILEQKYDQMVPLPTIIDRAK